MTKSNSPDTLALHLRSRGTIGDLQVRQARLFTSRIPDAARREDLQFLLLLLLATLYKGYPRAGAGEMMECVIAAGEERGVIDEDAVRGRIIRIMNMLAGDGGCFSPLISAGADEHSLTVPLIVFDPAGKTLSFHAYHAAGESLKLRLRELLTAEPSVLDPDKGKSALSSALASAFPAGRAAHIRQAAAAALALRQRFVVISGGPGTGKSTVVNLVVRAVCAGFTIPVESVVLCAPTGRAKARLFQAVTAGLPAGDPFATVKAKTIHSLLGIGRDGSPRYSRNRPLPMRLVVVDEVSMVDLRLFAMLLDALADDARLVLVGDMHQLPSVDAGAVLSDLTEGFGGARNQTSLSPRVGEEVASMLASIEGLEGLVEEDKLVTEASGAMRDHVIFLTKNYRSDRRILDWWRRRLDGAGAEEESGAVEYLRSPTREAFSRRMREWMEFYTRSYEESWLRIIKPSLLAASPGMAEAAVEFRRFVESRRILCAIHEGEEGRVRTNERCDRLFWKAKKGLGRPPRFHDGLPIIVNSNHGELDLYNGDIGVVLEEDGMLVGCFPGGEGVRKVSLERLDDVDAAYAVSVHKAQGSEFDEVMLLLPGHSAMGIGTKLVYTAVTRARGRVVIMDPKGILADPDGLLADDRPGLLRDFLG